MAFLASPAQAPDLAVVRDGVVEAGAARVAGSSPSVSPDGAWVAFASGRDGNPELYVARLRDGRLARITFTRRAAESSPDWSPDGRRLVHARGGDLYVTTLDRSRTRLLVRRSATPAWSPGGQLIAFERAGDLWTVRADGLGARKLRPGRAPAWSPDGRRLASVVGGDLYVGRRLVARRARAPSWSPDGRRIAFERRGAVWAVRADGTRQARLRTGVDPDWRARPALRELLPDLDQQPPSNLTVLERRGRWLLGFDSKADNKGDGPVEILGSRPSPAVRVMTAAQRVRLSSGAARLYPGVGPLRYMHTDSHLHWHYLAFEAYRLERADGSLVVRDRKRGFCLVDRRPPPGREPDFTGECASHDPDALHLREGTSPGFTDWYPAHFHGQNVDVTDVPAGRYVLVHHVNPLRYLRESDYTNNLASVLLRLTWPEGRDRPPRVKVLRSCPGSERCYAARG